MDYSLMIYFNNYSAFRVQTYIDMLKEYSHNSYIIESNIPPHITVAMWNSEDSFHDEIAELAANTEPFDVIFAGLGIFNSEDGRGNIHLSPVKSEEMTSFQKSFYDRVTLHDGDSFDMMYKDTNIWVPHVTIGNNMTKENIVSAMDKCLDIGLPQKAVAQKFVLAHCCPFTEIAVFELGK